MAALPKWLIQKASLEAIVPSLSGLMFPERTPQLAFIAGESTEIAAAGTMQSQSSHFSAFNGSSQTG